MQVGGRIEIEQRVPADHVGARDGVDERGLVLRGSDAIELRREWIQALVVCCFLVQQAL